MIQLFLIISFILGFVLGWKVHQFLIVNGIAYLASQDNPGVKIDEEKKTITISADILRNSNLNKENIK